MADQDTGDAPTLPSSLSQFVDSLPEGAASEWGQEAADKFNDFWAQQAVAQRNTQIGQQLTNSVGNFTSTMTGAIRANPTFTDTAIDIGHSTAKALVNDHPFVGEEQKPELVRGLGAEFAQQFARNGVMTWALSDADEAHTLLDKYQGLFPSEQVQHMRDHIDVLHDARQTDAQQQIELSDKQKADLSSDVLLNLVDGIATRGVPPGFNAKSVADQRLSPADTNLAQTMAQRAVDIAAGRKLPGKMDASLLMKQVTNVLSDTRTIPNVLTDLNRAEIPIEDVAGFGKLLQHPDDAKQFAWALNAAKIRNLGADGDSLSPANTDKLNEMAHFLLKQYGQVGAEAFKDLPMNPLAGGGLEAQLQTRAAKQARLDQIFAMREERSVYEQQRRQLVEAKFQAEQEFRKEQAAEARKARAEAAETRARELAQARAERAQQAALSRQARAQEVAAQLDERRAEREQRALVEAQKPAGRGQSTEEQIAAGNRLFRLTHRGP